MMTPALRKRIADAYRSGVDTRDIRKRFKVSWVTIYKILEEYNVERRNGTRSTLAPK